MNTNVQLWAYAVSTQANRQLKATELPMQVPFKVSEGAESGPKWTVPTYLKYAAADWFWGNDFILLHRENTSRLIECNRLLKYLVALVIN